MHHTENLQVDTVQLVEKGLIRSQFQGKSLRVENAQLVKIVSVQVVAETKSVQAAEKENIRVVEIESVQVVHILRLQHHHPRHPVVHQLNRLISNEHLRQKRKV